MNAKVGFNEVQNYAKTHNVDFKTAAQKLGLSAQEAAALEGLGGDPGAPVDGYQRTPEHSFTLKSGRKVNVYNDASGKKVFEYLAADGTKLNEAYFLKQEGLSGRHFAVNGEGKLVTVKNQEQEVPKEEKGFWAEAKEFVKDNAAGITAGAAVVIGGALCLTGVATPLGVGLLAVGGAVGLSSCSTDDDPVLPPEINNTNNNTINIDLGDQQALIEAFKKGIDELLAKIEELGYSIEEYGDKIIELLVQNNTYLEGISEELKNQGKQQQEIIEILSNINSTVQTISSLVEATNETLIVNGQNVNAKLEEILNSIKNGNATSIEGFNQAMQELKDLLLEVISNQDENIQISKDSNLTIKDILKKLNNLNFSSGGGISSEQYAELLEILKSIESLGQNINNKLDVIIEKFEGEFPDNSDIKAALERIEQYLQENNDKTDITNNLLTELLNKYQNGGLSEEMLEKLLNAISELGVNIGEKLDKIMTAINNISVGDSGANIEALIDKVLSKMDENTAAIIEAISNIKIEGGSSGGIVDLSSLEKMMSELLELTKGNNSLLTDINGKLDVLNLTVSSIESKLAEEFGKNDERYTNIMNILEVIKNKVGTGTGGTGYDDTALLEKLDKILSKLDEIAAAIKDHKVTVDITGEVTCECNCGGNHEGILGDLEDVLG